MEWTESNGVWTAESERLTFEIFYRPGRQYVLRSIIKPEYRNAAAWREMEGGEHSTVEDAQASAEAMRVEVEGVGS